MQLRQFEYVSSIVQWRTMHKAARHLYISEATISQQIRDLEAELGFPLFERGGQTLKLTVEGKKLLPRIQHILQAKHELEEQVAEIKDPTIGTIRFGISASPALTILPSILKSFIKLYPEVTLEVREGGSYELAAQVHDHLLDVAVIAISDVVPLDLKGLTMKKLIDSELVALASRHHRLAYKEQVSKEQLSRERLIVFREGYLARDLILGVLGSEAERNIIYSTDNNESARSLAQANVGILFQPRFVVSGQHVKRLDDLCILDLAADVVFPISHACIFTANGYCPRYLQVFIEIIQETCQFMIHGVDR
ncbi:MAG TPA: LysR family transcriptional regulator [Ktedonobacteraceae bacterium]|nr:LysR family transcriptional regulator [Ktedonobacteraceae bacterium]